MGGVAQGGQHRVVGVAGGGDMPLSTSSQCSSHLEHSRKSFNLSSPPDGSLFHFPNNFNAPGFSFFFFFFFFFFFVKLPRNFIGILSFSPPPPRDSFGMLFGCLGPGNFKFFTPCSLRYFFSSPSCLGNLFLSFFIFSFSSFQVDIFLQSFQIECG